MQTVLTHRWWNHGLLYSCQDAAWVMCHRWAQMNAILILELVYASLMYAPSAVATYHKDNLLQIKVNEDYIFSLNLLSTHFISGQKWLTHKVCVLPTHCHSSTAAYSFYNAVQKTNTGTLKLQLGGIMKHLVNQTKTTRLHLPQHSRNYCWIW